MSDVVWVCAAQGQSVPVRRSISELTGHFVEADSRRLEWMHSLLLYFPKHCRPLGAAAISEVVNAFSFRLVLLGVSRDGRVVKKTPQFCLEIQPPDFAVSRSVG